MLHHEEDVKQHREQAQAELGRITEDGRPIIVVVRIQNHLQHAQTAAGKVEENIADTPTTRALATIVHHGLRIENHSSGCYFTSHHLPPLLLLLLLSPAECT